MPKTNKLSNNYPNLFNPTTHINYQLKSLANISIVIYNYKGEKVRTLASGIYFYKMQTKGYLKIKRAVLVK